MKSLSGATLIACWVGALALAGGCSSGSPEPEPSANTAGSHEEKLRAPDPGEGDVNPCAVVLCPEGTTCQLDTGAPVCTPIEPSPENVFCGGIAAIECPGAGACVDDPADDCDPEQGGADCGGVCDCSGVLLLCIEGTVFDDSPDVCACVPGEPEVDACAAVRCAAGTHCEVQEDGAALCVEDDPNPCSTVLCLPDTVCEVVDGEPVCVDPGEPQFCGGIAGIECPGAGSCVDDPTDDCDPARGGADCGGVCDCSGVLLLCIPGTVFDDSPDVCACVPQEPEVNPCAAVSCLAGTTCEVHDGEAHCVPRGGHDCDRGDRGNRGRGRGRGNRR